MDITLPAPTGDQLSHEAAATEAVQRLNALHLGLATTRVIGAVHEACEGTYQSAVALRSNSGHPFQVATEKVIVRATRLAAHRYTVEFFSKIA